ncbi:hypothetical protein [Portibacter lacus]|uniref:DUF892 family protein n=1 Tax=Portibacter lacus TaxID=1099794 RepID=A0AA37SNX6_9BACT|nr:hypothetical protein [Portibacter lacus]GLR16762.1 hypothetical protein GCM10007940_13770 [Portibacter lacus]
MDINALRKKELSNLYAIFKQSNNYFNKAAISFLTDKNQLMLTYFIKFSGELQENITLLLNDLSINPGNTKDAIVQEITENLNEIIRMNIQSEVMEIGYLMSVNRLMGYQIANLENLSFFRNGDEKLEALIEATEEFKNIQQSIF